MDHGHGVHTLGHEAGSHGSPASSAASPGDRHEGHAGRGEVRTHDRHEGHDVATFRRRFWVSLLLSLPILAFGHMIPSAIGWSPMAFPGSPLIPPVLGTAVFIYGGWTFLEGALRELRSRLPGMMTLIALAIT